jgi:hypothetical protein
MGTKQRHFPAFDGLDVSLSDDGEYVELSQIDPSDDIDHMIQIPLQFAKTVSEWILEIEQEARAEQQRVTKLRP